MQMSFLRYEEDFLNAVKIVDRSIRQLENNTAGNVLAVIADMEAEVGEAEGYLHAMEVEAKNSGSNRAALNEKVSAHRREMQRCIRDAAAAKHKAQSRELTAGASSQKRFATANQILDNSTRTLEDTRQVLAETEDIGGNVLSEMESQKEVLLAAHGKVNETRQFTRDAQKILRMMGTRAVMHKLCMIFTILVLAAMIGVVAYYGFIDKKNKD